MQYLLFEGHLLLTKWAVLLVFKVDNVQYNYFGFLCFSAKTSAPPKPPRRSIQSVESHNSGNNSSSSAYDNLQGNVNIQKPIILFCVQELQSHIFTYK
jgi:hypothetical protein